MKFSYSNKKIMWPIRWKIFRDHHISNREEKNIWLNEFLRIMIKYILDNTETSCDFSTCFVLIDDLVFTRNVERRKTSDYRKSKSFFFTNIVVIYYDRWHVLAKHKFFWLNLLLLHHLKRKKQYINTIGKKNKRTW